MINKVLNNVIFINYKYYSKMLTKIYYYKKSFINNIIPLMFLNNIPSTFIDKINNSNYECVHIMSTIETENVYEYLELLFTLFNSEENPLYYNNYQRICDNTHINMSIGDIISYKDKLYIMSGVGFTSIS